MVNNPYSSSSNPYKKSSVRSNSVGHQQLRPYQSGNAHQGGVGGTNGATRTMSPHRMSSNSAVPEVLPQPLIRALKGMQNAQPTVVIPDHERSTLNTEQQQVVASVLSGHSTFFTGPAGSGKSHVLSTILRLNEQANLAPRKNIVITATTGIAACSIGGTTIHSFAGLGTGDGKFDDMIGRVLGNVQALRRWREVDTLIIDEISMMPGGFLDLLDKVSQRVRNDYRSFGGIQLVVCGDFFQLPPVNLQTGFAFEAQCWPTVIQCSILLKEVFRQNGDTALMDILNEARGGQLSAASVQKLRAHSLFGQVSPNRAGKRSARGGPSASDDTADEEIKPTLLECRNKSVDKANDVEMNKLPGDTREFKAKDKWSVPSYQKQLGHCSAPEQLRLKVGAQVILLKNLDPDKGLVNGTRGVVIDFQKPSSTSATIPAEFRKLELPVVQFEAVQRPGGDDGNENKSKKVTRKDLKITVEPAEWSNRVGDKTVSSRVQIPLRLAWALSVHKSQGMTIPHLTVNLQGVFEYGQAYVALSRATELDLLTLRGFRPECFRAHPKVKSFYRLLGGEETTSRSSAVTPLPARTRTASQHGIGGSSKKPGNFTPPGGVKPTARPPELTLEQKRSIEENRLRALQRRREREAKLAATKAQGSNVNDPITL